MFIFVVQTLQNKIYMKQLANGKHMENDCFFRTLKLEMDMLYVAVTSILLWEVVFLFVWFCFFLGLMLKFFEPCLTP
jgi:hypothetical protein